MFVTITPFRHLSIHHENNMLSTNINWLNPLLMCLHKYPWKIWKKLPFLFDKVIVAYVPIAFVDTLQYSQVCIKFMDAGNLRFSNQKNKKNNREQVIYGWHQGSHWFQPEIQFGIWSKLWIGPDQQFIMVQVCGGLFLEDKRQLKRVQFGQLKLGCADHDEQMSDGWSFSLLNDQNEQEGEGWAPTRKCFG